MSTTDPPHFPRGTPESVSWHQASADSQAGNRQPRIGPAPTISMYLAMIANGKLGPTTPPRQVIVLDSLPSSMETWGNAGK
jgi:hypothetical protein